MAGLTKFVEEAMAGESRANPPRWPRRVLLVAVVSLACMLVYGCAEALFGVDVPSESLVPDLPEGTETVHNWTDHDDRAGGSSARVLIVNHPEMTSQELANEIASQFDLQDRWRRQDDSSSANWSMCLDELPSDGGPVEVTTAGVEPVSAGEYVWVSEEREEQMEMDVVAIRVSKNYNAFIMVGGRTNYPTCDKE